MRLLLRRILEFARKVIGFLAWTNFIAVIIGTVALKAIGESNPTVAFLLYVPPSLWLLPTLALTPLALVHPKSGLLHVASALTILLFVFGWSFSSPAPPERRGVTLMTYNYGQHGGQSMRPFVDAEKPTLLAMQDVGRRLDGYRSTYPEYTIQGVGEFLLFSKVPFTASPPKLITVAAHPAPIASRFEILLDSTPVAVYVVHLPTPRNQLRGTGFRSLLAGLLPLPLPGFSERRMESRDYWQNRISMAQQLAAVFKSETLPTLVAGDFNTPHCGKIHRILFRSLLDSHEEEGSGFGFTFPGTTRNPLSLGGPWLRIDYVAADRNHWKVRYAKTEPDRPSQHRCHVGGFELIPAR